MNDQARKSLALLLVDLSNIPYKNGRLRDGDKIINLAGQVAAGYPTVFDKILER